MNWTKQMIRQLSEEFELLCTFDGYLQIQLKYGTNLLRGHFTDETLPEPVKRNLDSVENVFLCLQDKENYEVDLIGHEIRIKTVLQLKSKEIVKVSTLKLDPVEMDRLQIVEVNLQDVRRLVEQNSEKTANKISQFERQMADDLGDVRKKQKQQTERTEQMLRQSKNQFYTMKSMLQDNLKLRKNQSLENETKYLEKIKALQLQIGDLKKNYLNCQLALKEEIKQKQLLGAKIEILEQKLNNIQDKLQAGKKQVYAKQVSKISFSPQLHGLFSKYFQFFGNRVVYKGDQENTQVLFRKGLSRKSLNQFSVKIIKSRENFIGIGIVDPDQVRKERSPCYSGYAICFWGNNGRVRYGPGKNVHETGIGFSVGDIVTTTVDLEKGLIEWSVEGMIRASKQFKNLTKPHITVVPYMELSDSGDTVEWIE